jgi:hypothetical protein
MSAALAQLDALAPKMVTFGLNLDKISSSAGDVSRTTPIGQR